MLTRLIAFTACTITLLAPPPSVESQAPDTLRPRIVVDAFSFAAPVEPRAQSPTRQGGFPGGGLLGPPRPRYPTGGWGGHLQLRQTPFAQPSPRDATFSAREVPDMGDAASDDEALRQLGQGVADMLVERLLATGQFRILERQRLESVVREQGIGAGGETPLQLAGLVGARYYVTGTITRLGTEARDFGGGGGTRALIGLLGIRQRNTEAVLIARVVDTQSGEIVASVRGSGSSKKGSGFTLGGLGGGMGGIGAVGSREFRSSAIGEALDGAVAELAVALAAAAGGVPR